MKGISRRQFLQGAGAAMAAATLLMDHYEAPMNERLVKKLKVTSVIVIDIEEMTGKLSKKPKPADSLK